MMIENFKSYKHQIAARKSSYNYEGYAFLMGRGTGKTKTAIDEAVMFYQEKRIHAVLVIAPNDVHTRWVTEQFKEHLHKSIKMRSGIWVGQTSKKGIAALESLFVEDKTQLTVLSVNIEAFSSKRGTALAYNFCKTYKDHVYVIMDESTRIKNPSAHRTKAVLKLTKVSKYRRILTGNEVTKTPFEVYSQFKFLYEDFWDLNYHVFKNRYAEFITQHGQIKKLKGYTNCTTCQRRRIQPIVKGFFNRQIDDWDVKFYCPKCDHRIIFKKGTGDYITKEALKIKKSQGRYPYKKLVKFKKLDELKSKIAPFSYRVRKSDALPDLPEKIFSPIYTQLNEQQEQLYAQLKVELFAEYENELLEIPNKIALMMRFQQITGGFFPGEDKNILIGKSSPKMDRLLYDLEDVDEEAIIIWSVFVPEIEHIAKVLREKYPDDNLAMFYGGVKKKDRPEIITRFQNGDIRFLVANPSVGGTGLNLQRSTLHYYYSNGTKAEDRWQSEDRSHRSGQKNHVVYKDIIIPNTVDESIQKILTDNKTLSEFFKQPLEDMI